MRSRPKPWPGLPFGHTFWAGVSSVRDIVAVASEHGAGSRGVRGERDLLLLDAIESARDFRLELDDIIEELVIEARHAGVRWAAIGERLGIGGTAAQKRFGHLEADVRERVADGLAEELDQARFRLEHPPPWEEFTADLEAFIAEYGAE